MPVRAYTYYQFIRISIEAPHVNDVRFNAAASADFFYLLEKRPGAFIWIGNGDSKPLHHPPYDFDDRTIPYGIQALANLAERG